MEVGEFKRFTKSLGIARVFNEVTDQDWYVVYGAMCSPQDYELGKSIGKGKTEEEALIDALKYLYEFSTKTDNDCDDQENIIDDFTEKMDKFMNSLIFTNYNKVVLPARGWEYQNDNTIVDTEELINCDICIDEDGKAIETIG